MIAAFVIVVALVVVCAAFAAAARWSAEEMHRRTSHLRHRQLDVIYQREERQ